jgi:hypothetical protein
MYIAILNGKTVAESMAYAPLEAEYKGTCALIKNTTTGVEWPADEETYEETKQETKQE